MMDWQTLRTGAVRDWFFGIGIVGAVFLLGCSGQPDAAKTSATRSTPAAGAGGTAREVRSERPAGPAPSRVAETPEGQSGTKAAPTEEPAGKQDAAADMTKGAKQSSSAPSATKPPAAELSGALRDACYDGNKDTVREKLAQGADANLPDEGGRTALMLAAFNGHSAIVRTLLERDAKTNVRDAKGRTALRIGHEIKPGLTGFEKDSPIC